MAYTDFANIVAPSFWDEAQSGVYSIGASAVPSTLAEALALVAEPLASRWNGTRYEYLRPEVPDDPGTPEDDSAPEFYDQFAVLLVFPAILACNEIYIDQLSFDSDSPSVTFYGTDGNILGKPGDPLTPAYLLYGKDSEEVAPVEDTEAGGGFRRMYRLFWGDPFAETPEPVVADGIKAILISGFFDFLQGRPKRLYGLYGPVQSGEVPFWKDFSGQSNVGGGFGIGGPQWPFQGNRLTELF